MEETASRTQSATGAVSAQAEAEKLLAVVRQVVEDLHPSLKGQPVQLDSSIDRDLGLDSLGRAELISRLERTFGTGLPETLFTAAETPRDLLRALAQGRTGQLSEVEIQQFAAPLGAAAGEPSTARSLVDVLSWHVERHPERRHLTFLSTEGAPEELTYGELDRKARVVAAALRDLDLEAGQAVGLMLPSGLDYFYCFFGILMAGGVPVPLYPPVRPSQIEDHLRRQAGILDTALVRALITVPEALALARLVRGNVRSLRSVVTPADLLKAGPAASLPEVRESDTAFLQFTSGSTADPKGVVLTHRNLLANLRAISSSLHLSSESDTIVSWLPIYHDMGLIGAWMGSLYFAVPLVLMSPLTFLTQPARWLQAIHRYGGTLSAAPNFAYELCLNKIDAQEIEGLDLSTWRATLNGAEPVSAETIRAFSRRFAAYGFKPSAMMPVYGLAECSLALAFPPPGREPVLDAVRRQPFMEEGRAEPAVEGDEDAVEFVGCGYPLAGHEIRIVDATGTEASERQVGRLEFRGPSATSGYYRNPAANKDLFRGDWLNSGDLAYIAAGELFLTGRAKDMIIRAGRNIYPQELEEAIGKLEGVRKGCVAVFGSFDTTSATERLVVVAEVRQRGAETLASLEKEIQSLAADLTGTAADDIALVPAQSVPKTSSGKLRRAAARQLFESGKLGRRLPVWWQLARLAWSGTGTRLASSARAGSEFLHAGRFWLVVGLAAVPVAAAIVAAPHLARRRRVARRVARQMARLTATHMQVSGLEHLEGKGPRVVVANHASYLDGFALTASLPSTGAFLAKRELKRSFLARLLLERLGTLFVERFDPQKGVEDVQRALAALNDGESLLFFPEGTFDRAPGLRAFRLGAFHVAAQAGVPIVPVALRGTRSVLRGDAWFPRRGTVTVKVLPPILPRGADLAAVARLRDQAREVILQHCGEPDLVASATNPLSTPQRG